MAATKSGSVLANSVTVTSGGSATYTLNAVSSYGTAILASIIPAGTLSAGLNLTLNAAYDNATWMIYQQITSGTTSGYTYAYAFSIDAPIMYIQCVLSGSSGANTTVTLQQQTMTGV